MEYVYATLLLESVGEEVTQDNIKSILEAAEAEVDEKRIRALLSSWEQLEVGRDARGPDGNKEVDDETPYELREAEGTEEKELAESDRTHELDSGEEHPELDDGESEESNEGNENEGEHKNDKDSTAESRRDVGKPEDSSSYGELGGLSEEE